MKLNPNQANAFKILGILQLDKGNFKEAIAAFKQSLELNELNAEVYRLLGKIYAFDAHKISAIKKMLKGNRFEERDKKHIFFTFGEYYEGHGDYNKSWDYYQKGNNLISKKSLFSLNRENKKINLIKKLYFKLKKNDIHYKPSTKQIVFIVGLPRSGTTLIEQILSNNCFTHAGGEVDLISNQIDTLLFREGKNFESKQEDLFSTFNNIRKLYLSFIKKNSDKKIFTDKMPYNFLYIGIINAIFPEAKIIHVTRNPLDNFLSLYKTYFSDNSHLYSYDLSNILNYYKLYINHIKYWESLLPNYIYNISYEKLVNNPKSQIKKLIQFCNFEWDENYLNFHKNRRTVYTASAVQVRKKLYKNSINSWKNFSKPLTRVKKELASIN